MGTAVVATQFPDVQVAQNVIALGSSVVIPIKTQALRPGESLKREAHYPLLTTQFGKRLLSLIAEEQIPTLDEGYSALFIEVRQ